MMNRRIFAWILALLLVFAPFSLTSCGDDGELISDVLDLAIDLLEEESSSPTADAPDTAAQTSAIDEDGSYTSKEDVALYLWTYKHLPKNFLTKSAARALGWEGGSVEAFAPGCAIGGDTFGNFEEILPPGSYRECDIDTVGKDSRGACRLVYTADCSRIYFTDDHYETFTLLYGEETADR